MFGSTINKVHMEKEDHIWVFHGANGRFASGVFTSRYTAEEWIASNKLTGVLTLYPLNQGVYQWAVANDYFVPKKV